MSSPAPSPGSGSSNPPPKNLTSVPLSHVHGLMAQQHSKHIPASTLSLEKIPSLHMGLSCSVSPSSEATPWAQCNSAHTQHSSVCPTFACRSPLNSLHVRPSSLSPCGEYSWLNNDQSKVLLVRILPASGLLEAGFSRLQKQPTTVLQHPLLFFGCLSQQRKKQTVCACDVQCTAGQI